MKKLFFFVSNRHNLVYRIFLFLVSVSSILLFIPRQAAFNYQYTLGQRWNQQDISAPFDYPINKSQQQIDSETQTIISNSNHYFDYDTEVTQLILANYESEINDSFTNDSLFRFVEPAKHKAFVINSFPILKEIYSKGVLQNEILKNNKKNDFVIYIFKNNVTSELYASDCFTIQESIVRLLSVLPAEIGAQRSFYVSFFEKYLKPNLTFNSALTLKAQEESLSKISPSIGMIEKGENVIKKGDLITDEKFQLLESLKKEYETQTDFDENDKLILFFGQFIIVVFLIGMLYLFIALLRPEVLEDNLKLTFLFLSLVVVTGLASLNFHFELFNFYVIPFCVLPILLRVFYDTKVALFAHIIALIFAGLIIPNPFEFFIIEFSGGVACIFSVVNLRKRSMLFLTIFLLLITYSIIYSATFIVLGGHLDQIQFNMVIWFASSAALTLFSYPLIYAIEKIFGFTSDISLLELTDTNNDLLKELALNAPGTFQHSLQVANLAESAIALIGGNALLTRAGALYHDIGKMDTARYFIENQVTGVNPHDDLDNEESARIIISHVIKGVKLAKKNRLPESVIDFIRTHHGTTMVQYFYRSELKNKPEKAVDEAIFTYPGPIPYSKETAVVMMADGVEATSRSMKKFDGESIEKLVEGTIDRLINENQFINADITFKDITIIKKTFKKMLMNIYHVRVDYPK